MLWQLSMSIVRRIAIAHRGTSKRFSVEQEEYIASLYKGRRSPSSGAAESDAGDVRSEDYLIECKVSGAPGSVKAKSGILRHLEKIWEEATAEGRDPVLCVREFQPDSPLADRDGWVDLSIVPSANHARPKI